MHPNTPLASGTLVRVNLWGLNSPSNTYYAQVMEVFKPRCNVLRAAALFVFEGSSGYYIPYVDFEYLELLSPGGGGGFTLPRGPSHGP